MLTPRGWWFLFWVAFLTLQAVLWMAFSAPFAAILGITLLLMTLTEWALFLWRTRELSARLVVERTVSQGGRGVPVIWAGLPATVRMTVRLTDGPPLPFVVLTDAAPVGAEKSEGSRRVSGRLGERVPLEVEYGVSSETPGAVRFEGIEVRVADLMGFFTKRVFVRLPVDVPVLPPLFKEEGGQRATKRFNSLPPPGAHRLRRAGGGGDLLDLRDYRPGDPPKTIAWKVSARRDRLITKEFETDVPVRCAVFLDASATARLGSTGRTPLARMASIAAGVAQAASANRDFIGLTVFDEETVESLKPARTRGHTLRMLRAFADAAARGPENTETDPRVLQRHAFALAQEFYPDLLEKRWNSKPLSLFWLPLLDSKWSRLLFIPFVLQTLMMNLSGLNLAVDIARDVVRPRAIWDVLFMLPVMAFMMLSPSIIAGLAWLGFGLRGFLPPRPGELGKRKQLAMLFAARWNDGAAAVERAIHDDAFFAERCGRFLAEHRRTPPAKLLDPAGRYRFRGEAKLAVLAANLRRSVAAARDNELYAIFLDPTDLDTHLEPLERAVRAARAKHHQVLVLLTDDEPPPPPGKKSRRLTLNDVVRSALTEGRCENMDSVRRKLARAGAALVPLNADDGVRTVLARLDRLRGGRVLR